MDTEDKKRNQAEQISKEGGTENPQGENLDGAVSGQAAVQGGAPFTAEAAALRAQEEFAAETAVPTGPARRLNQPEDERPDAFRAEQANEGAENKTWGWVAIILAIASLFMWPAVVGPIAAVMGFIAVIRGNRALGIWSIVIGLVAFVAYVAFVPFFT